MKQTSEHPLIKSLQCHDNMWDICLFASSFVFCSFSTSFPIRLYQVSEMAVSELPGNPNAVWTVRRHVEGNKFPVSDTFLQLLRNQTYNVSLHSVKDRCQKKESGIYGMVDDDWLPYSSP